MLLTTDRYVLFSVDCKLSFAILERVVVSRVTKHSQEVSCKAGDSTNEGIIPHKHVSSSLSKFLSPMEK